MSSKKEKHPAVHAVHRLLTEVVAGVSLESDDIERGRIKDPEYESLDPAALLGFWPHLKFFDELLASIEVLKLGEQARPELVAQVKAYTEIFASYDEEFGELLKALEV